MTEGRYILDLTRPEGAGILEENFFLYSYVNQIEDIIREFLEYDNTNRNRNTNIVEFYSTNIFINGERGVGKTSVLLTIYDHLQRNQGLEVLPIIDLSTNVQSILIYLLAHLKKKYYELLDSESYCDEKLDELFYNLEINFPIFLKCFCNSSCEIICKEDISSLLEKNEIEFLKNLHNFIDKLLRKLNKRKLVIIIDDFDVSYESKTIIRLLIELGVFLNHKDVIVIGSGNLENLYRRVRKVLEEQTQETLKSKNLENLVHSFIEKVFPMRNVINIEPVDIYFLEESIKIKWDNNKEGDLESFLKRHPTLNKLFDQGNQEIIYISLDKKPIRNLVQFLKNIDKKIREYINIKNSNHNEQNQKIHLKQFLIGDVFINQLIDKKPYIKYLKTDINLVANMDPERDKIEIQNTEKNQVYHQVWKIYREFHFFLKGLFKDNFDYFNWKTLTDFSNDRFRFLDLLYLFDENLYSAFYIWLFEMFLYLKTFILPLFIIIWNYLYGLPIALYSLEEQEEKSSRRKDFKDTSQIVEGLSIHNYLLLASLYNIVEYDNSLNLINYKLRGIRVKDKHYIDFILFGKYFKTREEKIPNFRFYFYKIFLNTFLANLNYGNIIKDKGCYGYLLDIYSHGHEEDIDEIETIEKENIGNFDIIKKIWFNRMDTLHDFLRYIDEKCLINLDPLFFDKTIFNFILRIKDISIRRSANYKTFYKYIFNAYFPYFEFINLLNYEIYKEASSLIFKRNLLKLQFDSRSSSGLILKSIPYYLLDAEQIDWKKLEEKEEIKELVLKENEEASNIASNKENRLISYLLNIQNKLEELFALESKDKSKDKEKKEKERKYKMGLLRNLENNVEKLNNIIRLCDFQCIDSISKDMRTKILLSLIKLLVGSDNGGEKNENK